MSEPSVKLSCIIPKTLLDTLDTAAVYQREDRSTIVRQILWKGVEEYLPPGIESSEEELEDLLPSEPPQAVTYRLRLDPEWDLLLKQASRVLGAEPVALLHQIVHEKIEEYVQRAADRLVKAQELQKLLRDSSGT